MKKILCLLAMCLYVCTFQAQNAVEHIKFMGIELNGTITAFHSKLLAKGAIESPLSKQAPKGTRVYDCTFSGEEATIAIHYDPQTNIVYSAKAIISRFGKENIERVMNNMESKLDLKYGTDNKETKVDTDDYLHELRQCSYLTDNGIIGLTITSTGYSPQSEFHLHIEYYDSENYLKQTQKEMDDL